MSLKKGVSQVVFWSLLAKLGAAFAVVITIRFMGVSSFAQLAVGLVVANTTAQAAGGGINRAYVIEFSNVAAAPWLRTLLLQLFLASCIGATVALILRLLPGPFVSTVVLTATYTSSEFMRCELQRRKQFHLYGISDAIRQGLYGSLLLAVVLFSPQLDSPSVMYIRSFSAIAILIAIIFFITYTIPRNSQNLHYREGSTSRTSWIITSGGFLTLYSGMVAVLGGVDLITLNFIADDQTISGYAAAFRYYALLLGIIVAVRAVVLPSIASSSSHQEIEDVFAQQRQLTLIFAVGVFIVATTAQWWIPLIDGGKYPESVSAFQILAVSAVGSFLFSPHLALAAKEKMYLSMIILATISIIVAVGLNVILTPRLGPVGTAFATLCGFAVLNFGGYVLSRRRRRIWLKSDELHVKVRA